ncbi:hypothetical protein D3C72_1803280 [compost metagenome]
MGQQYLGTAQVLFAQLGFVHLHQAHLANGGSGLQLMNLLGALVPAQALHALGNGAAGDHDDFALDAVIAMHQGSKLAAPFGDGAFIQALAFVGDQTGADLDHDATCVAQNIRCHFLLFLAFAPAWQAQAAINK